VADIEAIAEQMGDYSQALSTISDRNLSAVIGFATTGLFDLAALFIQFPELAGRRVQRSH
jgi:hypothetical protein